MRASRLERLLLAASGLPAVGALLAISSVAWHGGLHVPVPETLLLGFGAAALCSGATFHWVRRVLTRPLRELVAAAEALAAGHRISLSDLPLTDELRALSRHLEGIQSRFETIRTDHEIECDRTRTILDHLSDGVLVMDGAGIVRLANPTLRKLTDLAGYVDGEHFRLVIRHPEIVHLLQRVVATGTAAEDRIRLADPDRLLGLSAAPLGHRSGTILTARDLTPNERLATQRSELVANVSHELKTPLTAIRGYAETLDQGAVLDDPEASKRFTKRILEQCARLQSLLRDLLSLSRIESAENPPALEELELAPVVTRAIEVLAPAAEAAQVLVESEVDDSLRLWGDRDAIEQILLNLLENAIKYNRNGGRVSVRAQDLGAETAFEVIDSGIGIPARSIQRVFERFYRVDKARSRDAGGTGLGLAIVKHLVRLHGGRIDVESEPDRGSTFRVTLTRPEREDASSDSPAPSSSTKASPSSSSADAAPETAPGQPIRSDP